MEKRGPIPDHNSRKSIIAYKRLISRSVSDLLREVKKNLENKNANANE